MEQMIETPLRAYRKRMRVTLADLAKKLDVSEAQLSRIERHGTTSLQRALDLAARTGLHPADFAISERPGVPGLD